MNVIQQDLLRTIKELKKETKKTITKNQIGNLTLKDLFFDFIDINIDWYLFPNTANWISAFASFLLFRVNVYVWNYS